MSTQPEWYSPEAQFFGVHYLEGDDSLHGYLPGRQMTLGERTAAEVAGIRARLELAPGSDVLDVPCGYGRHSIGLAAAGMRVTGVDLNPVHLERARRDAGALPGVTFLRGDMRHLHCRDAYDAVINMFYSFGFFATDAENVDVLRGFHRALRRGGRFLFHTDVNVARVRAGTYAMTDTRALKGDRRLHIRERFEPETQRMHGSWTIEQADGSSATREYDVRVYGRDEFVELCRSVGFKQVDAYGDWAGESCTDESADMIVVAVK